VRYRSTDHLIDDAMQLLNETAFAAEGAVLIDAHARQHWVIAVKASYHIEENGDVRPTSAEPVCAATVYDGDPEASAPSREGELVVAHPGTDVSVVGNVVAPNQQPVTSMLFTINIGSRQHTIRVTGERYWERGISSLRASDPEPFTAMPITYARAFGGQWQHSDTGAWNVHAPNPIGRGFVGSRDAALNTPLPNFESLAAPLRSWSGSADVVGTGPLAAGWAPRVTFAGTADADWAVTRAPLAPLDFDERFHVTAPPELHFDPPLRGGETIAIRGCTPVTPLTFVIPKLALGFDTRIRGTIVRHRAQLDRVIIDTTTRRLMTVYRTSLALGVHFRSVEYTAITEKRWLW
jgi:hypothetical protein